MKTSVRIIAIARLLIGLLATAAPAAFAANLIVDSVGNLIGATGVDVNGTLYSVEFLDGTCAEFFSGCNEVSDFPFSGDSLSAVSAAEALLDQVFIDSALGDFDSNPTLTRGCSDAESCSVSFPFALFAGLISSSEATNFSAASGFPDVQSGGSTFIDATDDFTLDADSAYVRFTAVPLPAGGLLLLAGLAGLNSMRRNEP